MKAVGRTRRHIIQRAGLIALFAGVLHVFLTGYSCGLSDVGKGHGEPCTRSSECIDGLACTAGVCREIDAGSPFDGGDASLDGAIDDGSISTEMDGAADDASPMDAEIDSAMNDGSSHAESSDADLSETTEDASIPDA
jgi:hypothetical protein